MLSFAYLPLYFWAESIESIYFTQNRPYINKQFLITRYILNKRKPNVTFFHVFGLDAFFATQRNMLTSLMSNQMKQYS